MGANDTGIKLFNILEQSSVLTIHNAHQDNIKKVCYLPGNQDIILSASSDRTVKLWDLRNTQQALSTVKLAHQIEDLCAIHGTPSWVVANGSLLTVLNVTAAAPLTRVADYQAFQRPVMRVRWDKTRERLMAAGMDQQLKVFA